jgi:tetratricopeptide (TPR) repeat protein
MMNSIGVTLNALGRRTEARVQLEQALLHHVQTTQTQLEGHALAALGDLCWETAETDRAWDWYDRSLHTRQSIGDLRGEGWMLQRLARVRASRGDWEQADTLLKRAAELSIRCSDDELMDACAQLRRQ